MLSFAEGKIIHSMTVLGLRNRCAWFINARKAMTVPGLPHLHLWVVKVNDDNLAARLGSTLYNTQNPALKGGSKKGGKKGLKH